MFKACLRSDRHVKPEMKEYEFLNLAECKNLRDSCLIVDPQGKIANVRITSLKTWATRQDVQIGWKFGLYEYGKELITTDENQMFFVRKVESTES